MASVGSLVVDLLLDAKGLTRGSEEAEKAIKRLEKQAESAQKALKLGFVAASTAALGAAAAIAKLTVDSIALTARQADLAQSMNSTVTGLRAVNRAAADNSIGDLDSSLARLNRRLGAAQNAGIGATQSLREIGTATFDDAARRALSLQSSIESVREALIKARAQDGIIASVEADATALDSIATEALTVDAKIDVDKRQLDDIEAPKIDDVNVKVNVEQADVKQPKLNDIDIAVNVDAPDMEQPALDDINLSVAVDTTQIDALSDKRISVDVDTSGFSEAERRALSLQASVDGVADAIDSVNSRAIDVSGAVNVDAPDIAIDGITIDATVDVDSSQLDSIKAPKIDDIATTVQVDSSGLDSIKQPTLDDVALSINVSVPKIEQPVLDDIATAVSVDTTQLDAIKLPKLGDINAAVNIDSAQLDRLTDKRIAVDVQSSGFSEAERRALNLQSSIDSVSSAILSAQSQGDIATRFSIDSDALDTLEKKIAIDAAVSVDDAALKNIAAPKLDDISTKVQVDTSELDVRLPVLDDIKTRIDIDATALEVDNVIDVSARFSNVDTDALNIDDIEVAVNAAVDSAQIIELHAAIGDAKDAASSAQRGIDKLGKAAGKVKADKAKSLSDALAGIDVTSDAATNALSKLGISVDELNNATGKQRIDLLNRALADGADNAGQTAIALQELGLDIKHLDELASNIQDVELEVKSTGFSEAERRTLGLKASVDGLSTSGGPAAKALQALGLNAAELGAADADEKLALIADAIKDSGVSAQQATRYLQDLGFQQAGVYNIFKDGGDAIRGYRGEVEKLGLAVSDIEAIQIQEAQKALASMGDALEGVKNQLAVQLAPMIGELATLFNSFTQEGVDGASAIEKAIDAVVDAVAFLADAGMGVKRTFEVGGKAIAVAMLAAKANVLEFANAVINGPVGAVNELIEQLNRIPKVKIESVSSTGFGDSVKQELAATKSAINAGLDDMHETLMQPMPSESIKQWRKDVEDNARQAALKVAEEKAKMNTDGSQPDAPEFEQADLDVLQKRLDAQLSLLREYGMNEKELLDAQYAEQVALLRTANKASLLNDQEYFAARRQAQELYSNELEAAKQNFLERELGVERNFNANRIDLLNGQLEQRKELLENSFLDEQERKEALEELERQHAANLLEAQREFFERELELKAEVDEEEGARLERIYQERQAKLEEALRMQRISKEQHDEMMLQSEREYTEGLRALERQRFTESLSVLQTSLGQMSTLMNSHSKKMFEIGKVAAIASATISTAQGMAEALKLGFPMGLVAAAAVGAAGAVQIANIKRTKLGGGGTQASVGSNTTTINDAATPVQSAVQAPRQDIYIHTDTPDNFVRSGDLIDAINEEISSGKRIATI